MKYKTSIAVAVIASILGFTGCASQPMGYNTRGGYTGRVSRSVRYAPENAPYYGTAVTGFDQNAAVTGRTHWGTSYDSTNRIVPDASLGRGVLHTKNLTRTRNIGTRHMANTRPVAAPLGNKPATTVASNTPAATGTTNSPRVATAPKRVNRAARPLDRAEVAQPTRSATNNTTANTAAPKASAHKKVRANRAAVTKAVANKSTTKRNTVHKATVNKATPKHTTAHKPAVNRATPKHTTAHKPAVNKATPKQTTAHKPAVSRSTPKHSVAHNATAPAPMSAAAQHIGMASGGSAAPARNNVAPIGRSNLGATASQAQREGAVINGIASAKGGSSFSSPISDVNNGLHSGTRNINNPAATNASNNPYVNYGIVRSKSYGLDNITKNGIQRTTERLDNRAGMAVSPATRGLSQNQQHNRNRSVARTRPDGTINNRARSFSDIGITANHVREHFENVDGPIRSGSKQVGSVNGNPHLHYSVSYGRDYGRDRLINQGGKVQARRNATRNGLPVDNATRSFSRNQHFNRNQDVARINPDGTINNRVRSLEDIGLSSSASTEGTRRVRTHNASKTNASNTRGGHNYAKARRTARQELAGYRSGIPGHQTRGSVTRGATSTRGAIGANRNQHRIDGIGMRNTPTNTAKLQHTVYRSAPAPQVIGII